MEYDDNKHLKFASNNLSANIKYIMANAFMRSNHKIATKILI